MQKNSPGRQLREHYKEQWHWNCPGRLERKVAMISNKDRVSDIGLINTIIAYIKQNSKI